MRAPYLILFCHADDSVGIYRVIGSRDALDEPLQIMYASNAGGVSLLCTLPAGPAAHHVSNKKIPIEAPLIDRTAVTEQQFAPHRCHVHSTLLNSANLNVNECDWNSARALRSIYR